GDDRAFADREALLTDDLTIDLAVNPDRALEGDLPTDLATAVEVRETRLLMGGLRLTVRCHLLLARSRAGSNHVRCDGVRCDSRHRWQLNCGGRFGLDVAVRFLVDQRHRG